MPKHPDFPPCPPELDEKCTHRATPGYEWVCFTCYRRWATALAEWHEAIVEWQEAQKKRSDGVAAGATELE